MGFKLPGKSIQTGTSGHSSALKMVAEQRAASALKQMEIERKEAFKDLEQDADEATNKGHIGTEGSVTVNATGTEFSYDVNPKGKAKSNTIKIDKDNVRHKAILAERWKKGDKASGGNLNELVAARKKHKKGSAEYAEIQNKINKSLGSKKVHKGTEVTKKGETVETTPKGTKKTVITDDKGTKDKSDDTTTTENRMKGLQRKKGRTLEFTRKVAEKERISKEREDIKGAKESGDKVEKAQSQKEISLIKSGRDDAKTGTVLSRAWHKGRAKRKTKKEARLIEKQSKK